MNYSKRIKTIFKNILNKLPYVKTLHQLNSNSKFPAGHYYSTVISLNDIKKRQNEIWPEKVDKDIIGIDLNTTAQLELLKELCTYYHELPFPETIQEKMGYYYNNSYYSYTDAIVLFLIIRKYKPQQIIEIGSGYSSAVMVETNDLYFKGNIKLKFIEPFPEERLNHFLGNSERDNIEIIKQMVQKVSLEVFQNLEPGDILFIDSTHSVKTGSDVNYILFEVLPVLKEGVIVHFHDIHFPFEYPKDWVLNGFGWNESYFLRAFLMYNDQFSILLFSDYLQKFYKNAFSNMPLTHKKTGSNLWLVNKGRHTLP